MSALKKSKEEQIKALLAKHSFPPVEVIIPILEKAGRGEQELTNQICETSLSLVNGVKEILSLEENNMKNLAKMFEVLFSADRMNIEPIELSETRFSFTVSNCPMLHVAENVSTNVKSKFCDLICNAGAKAIVDTMIGTANICTWDKALIKGAGKCKVTVELGKTK